MKSPLVDKATAELIGKIAVLEGVVAQLIERADQQGRRIRFLEERPARRPSLLTEKEAAAILKVHVQSMKRWRDEKPARIPFILLEGGDVRYDPEEIERYLKSRERGAKKGSAK